MTFIKKAKNKTGNKVKILRTDNVLENMNSNIKCLLEEIGVIHQRSVIYTPQQNGRAECEMRTIVETARTMLYSANLSKSFWAEAVNTAVFILNRTGPVRRNTTSSFKTRHSKRVNMSIFKIFCSKIAAHIPKERRLKLDAKSKEGIFLVTVKI